MGDTGECDCRQARAWREYWTAEAIAERLRHEVELYRALRRDAWAADIDAGHPWFRDAPREPRWNVPTFAELEARRAEPGVWPPERRRV